jgi:nucleotide-binding universal stress UspA family protein
MFVIALGLLDPLAMPFVARAGALGRTSLAALVAADPHRVLLAFLEIVALVLCAAAPAFPRRSLRARTFERSPAAGKAVAEPDRMNAHRLIQHILVAHDLTESSDPVLQYALRLASSYAAVRVTVFHAYEVPSMGAPEVLVLATDWVPQVERRAREEVDRIVARVSQGSMAVAGVVHDGRPSREIDRYAREHDVDLIVMGTHSRRGLPHALLGSIAEKVVRTAPCPVLVVRGLEAAV